LLNSYGNKENDMDGLMLLKMLNDSILPLVFFDPQYRGIMDKMSYGNEGARQKKRVQLVQMSEEIILHFICEISRVLKPSGYLMLWIDKFHLCEGIKRWFYGTDLEVVDLMTWDKGRIGMGYRTRRKSEYLVITQKHPRIAKATWTVHNIPDVWQEKATGIHPHKKPENLQTALIQAVTKEGDYVGDFSAGGYSVMRSAHAVNRCFIGCDLGGKLSDGE
jgi:site-specific DNA-methyltransferase (adenine-specific)